MGWFMRISIYNVKSIRSRSGLNSSHPLLIIDLRKKLP